jgi:hypothetical protein
VKFLARLALWALTFAFAFAQSTVPTLAGSTGVLSGTIVDATASQPLAGARVTVTSPSQQNVTTTDASGSFSFLSLAPDTYTLVVEKSGYETINAPGITIQADQTQRVAFRANSRVQTIGTTRARNASSLVRPGTTTDSYSINAATQERITGLGGGGSLNQAYSALAATPGVSVPSAQSGWSNGAGVTVRGGTHSQIGYEFDGVPTNTSVNNFSSTNLSTLGQQELQVYSGSAPLNSEAQGLSGFINQVVKTGTYPGFASFDYSTGTPSAYQSYKFEAGGATPNRLFSWYVGTLAANQTFRVIDQFNGVSDTFPYGFAYGTIPCPGGATSLNYASCYKAFTPGGLGTGPGGFLYTPPNYLDPAAQKDREDIVNLHFGLPHKDGNKDDVQLLYQTGYIKSDIFSSADDFGLAPYNYAVGTVYTGPVGQFLPSNYTSQIQPYAFPPNASTGQIPAGLRDQQQNGQSIFKAQYTHQMGSNAYLRVYGYSLDSYFFYDAPNGASSPLATYNGEPPDYKLWTHTSGYSAEFADQLSSKHLLLAQASWTHAPSVKDNSATAFTGQNTAFAVAVDSTNPNSGLCYGIAGGIATPASCQPGAGQASFVTLNKATTPTPLTGVTCGSGPCQYYVVENGYNGLLTTTTQNTIAASLSDQWHPNSWLTVEYGARFHQYQIRGTDTSGGTIPFWFNAYNMDYCVNANPGNTPVSKANLGIAVTAACSTASTPATTYTSVNMVNAPSDYNFNVIEPRVGATFTVNPDDVVRLSAGKYTQMPPTAFQEYATQQQNLPAYLAPRFYAYGYTAPGHDLPPQESYNFDLSLEHQIKGTDMSIKFTPFYRTTRNEIQEFFINPAEQLTSGLPFGSLKAGGFELLFRKGSFDRDGLSTLFAFTYTNARINYNTLPGGGSALTPINNDIKTYNAYTSYCASHPTDKRCGSTNASNNSGTSAACFTPGGVPDPACATGDIANPYWNAPVQNLLDTGASYYPTDPVIATTGLGVNSYTVPFVATWAINYRKGGFAITPSFQFQAGQRYGAPEANAGIDPGAGCSALPGSTTGDPRYPYGAAGGAPYDALTCNAALNAIPNVYTGSFDSIGAFVSPSQLLLSTTISYDFNKRFGISLVAANIMNQCFGGSKEYWTNNGPHVCSYESGEVSRGYAPTGNVYNPGATFEPFAQYPYFPYLGPYTMGVVNPNAPFQLYISAHLKL